MRISTNISAMTANNALKRTADALKVSCADNTYKTFIARYGGDEFIVIIPDVDEAEFQKTLPGTRTYLLSEIRPTQESRQALETYQNAMEALSERKRHDLMCLLYLGRDITYYGFQAGAVSEFLDYADEWGTKPTNRLRGCVNPDYLMGKPIGKWIGAVREALSGKD